MEHLSKFFDYIVESSESDEFDRDYLNDLLVPFSDLGIDVSVNDYQGLIKTVTKGEFSGRGYINISFRLDKLEKVNSDEYFGNYRNMISDDKFWEFLDEFISFKNRLNSDKVLVYFNMNMGGILNPVFGVSFLVPGDFKSDVFELEKAYDSMRRRRNRGTTDFYHNIIFDLDKENKVLKVRCGMSYTDRKFNNLMRDIDKSLFNIEKVDVSEDSFGQSATILITQKD